MSKTRDMMSELVTSIEKKALRVTLSKEIHSHMVSETREMARSIARKIVRSNKDKIEKEVMKIFEKQLPERIPSIVKEALKNLHLYSADY